MSRDQRTPTPRSPALARGQARAASVVPEPPESSFWLERTPLPVARKPQAAAPAGAAAAGRPALTPPSTVCPKCDSPLSPSEAACPACGLRRIMFGRFRASHTDRVPPALEALWRQVEAEWSSPELHERFLAQVSLCGSYAYAAARYRKAARQRQSDAIAKLQLERLSRMVHAVMAVSAVRTADERGKHPYRGLLILLLLLVGLGGAGLVYMSRRGDAAEKVERVPASIKVRRGRSVSGDGRPAPAFGGMRAATPRADAGAEPDQVDDEDSGRAEDGAGDEQ